jgi:hypothetical protein
MDFTFPEHARPFFYQSCLILHKKDKFGYVCSIMISDNNFQISTFIPKLLVTLLRECSFMRNMQYNMVMKNVMIVSFLRIL